MNSEELNKLLEYLLSLPGESEWVEFKQDNFNPEELGEYLSALSNSACLHEKTRGYLVYGIEDNTKKVVGTRFNPTTHKIKGQELLNWLDTQIQPSVQFTSNIFLETKTGLQIVIFEVYPALGSPVKFKNESYIRIGSYKKKLKDHTSSERSLWEKLNTKSFESQLAIENVPFSKALDLIDYPSFFDMLKLPLPDSIEKIMSKLSEEKLVNIRGDLCDITNLGALLFAKKMESFEHLGRKAIRVIVYKGDNRNEQAKEQIGLRGYASGFEGLIHYINDQVPTNELIGQAIRVNTKMYPEIAIRELVANALIHQDLSIKGTSPLVEVFNDRIEFSNPGKPLIDIMRFLDHSPQSRNEKVARLMRRVGVCEERGSGIDKVIFHTEIYQLPAPDFEKGEFFTRVTLFAHKTFSEMGKKDRIRAAYQHACLKYVSNQQMTNESLRKRFNISDKNYPIASRVINDAIEEKLVKPFDAESKSRKYARYVPFWA